MTSVSLPTKRLAAMLCTTGLMLAAGAAHAQAGNADSSQSRYQQDVAACKSGTTGQPLDTCLREAGAARQERNRQNLRDDSPEQLQQNMLARCSRLPEAQRQNCVTQMTSPSNVRGSVQGGGVLRETVIQVPAGTAPGHGPGSWHGTRTRNGSRPGHGAGPRHGSRAGHGNHERADPPVSRRRHIGHGVRAQPLPQSGKMAAVAISHAYSCPTSSP